MASLGAPEVSPLGGSEGSGITVSQENGAGGEGGDDWEVSRSRTGDRGRGRGLRRRGPQGLAGAQTRRGDPFV